MKDRFWEVVNELGISFWVSRGEAGNFEIVEWSAGAEKLYGIPREKAVGANYLDLFVSPEEREQSRVDCARILAGQQYKNFSAEDVDASGRRRTVLTNCTRVWDPWRKEWLQAEIGVDVTSMDESQEMLRRIQEVGLRNAAVHEREELLDRIQRVATAITSLSSEEDGFSQVLTAISAGVRSLTDGDAITRVWRARSGAEPELLQTEDTDRKPFRRDAERDAVRWMLTKGAPVFVDSKTRRPRLAKAVQALERAVRPASIALVPMHFGQERTGVMVSLFPSLPEMSTELQRALTVLAQHTAIAMATASQIEDLRRQSEVIAENKERETTEKLTDDFVHRARHVVTPIAAYTQLLKERVSTLDPNTQGLLLDGLNRIEDKATDFLSRIREIASGLEPSTFDLAALLEGQVRDLDAQHPELRVAFIAEVSGEATVFGIRPFVFSALENVLNNAVDAMERQGKLSVSVSSEDGYLEVVVRDTGPGIPQGSADDIWHRSYTTKGQGHGYGLWRTRQVLEELGGTAEFVRSSAKGTTFLARLPRADPGSQRNAESNAMRSAAAETKRRRAVREDRAIQ